MLVICAILVPYMSGQKGEFIFLGTKSVSCMRLLFNSYINGEIVLESYLRMFVQTLNTKVVVKHSPSGRNW